MSDSQQLALTTPAHNNQHLFSDHYLNDILSKNSYWQALDDRAQPVMEQIAQILKDFAPSSIERQTEEGLVMPVLKLLGHTFEVQPSLKTPEGTKTPDYVFYSNTATLTDNKGKVLDDALPQQGGIAVGDAKYWERPLDIIIKDGSADALSNKNPSYQIYFYMLHSGVAWGILTNGRQWRLYHKDTAHKLECFYEVDLQELVQSGDVGRFLYFYAFFRREAFDEGALSLATILRGSADYARNVGNTLKDQVYDALRHIAQGFLDYTPNGLKSDAKTLDAVYDNSLILLYRLIFILYAEARELLPLRENQQYRDIYSLHAIKNSVSQDLAFGRTPLAGTALLWPRLKELFNAINAGNPPLSIATYNGGLFDPGKHEFLTKNTVGDAHLQQAIDKLARVNGEFVDYRDLSVRHMGTIYEGLLEYRLQPLSTPEENWTLALVNDKGERKATGSYYTPDYIVKYIVEQTVGPVLERVVDGKNTDAEKLGAVLKVNVLDPAMGSGHFLVEATEFIARFLVDLALLPEGKTQEEADLAFWKRRVVQSCIYGVDLNPLAVELAKLSLWLTTVAKDKPLSFLDHHLRPGNSLVGTRIEDLNLAGNGKKRKSKATSADNNGQGSLFRDSDFVQRICLAVGFMEDIEASEAEDVAQVKAQERAYEQLRQQLVGKYGKVLDVSTAKEFGLEVDPKLRPLLNTYAMSNGAAKVPALDKILKQTKEIADRERFFHWELEFPEIYFDRFGHQLGDEGGFEAVVGNPPYVRQEQLAPYKPYFDKHYPSVYHGVADIFVYFFAQGLRQAQEGGMLSYISSNSWLRANYATPLRRYLRESTTVEQVVDLGDNRVFEEAPDVYPAIHVVRKSNPGKAHVAKAAVFSRGEGVRGFAGKLEGKLMPVSMHDQDDTGWQLETGVDRALFMKLAVASDTLDTVVDGHLYYGIKTGLNDAFVVNQATRDRLIEEDPSCTDILKPMLRGEDLRPWYQEDEGKWLIVFPSGWTLSKAGTGISEQAAWRSLSRLHPSVAAHLKPYAEQARTRCDQGDFWWELRPCVYYEAFERPKVLWPDIARFPRFSWDDTGYYLGNTGYIAVTDQPWLLAYLSSRCAWFLISHISIALGERAGMNRYRLIDQYMRSLPVRVPTEEQQKALGEIAMSITSLARERYQLHVQARHRIQTDLGTADKKLNQKLTAWWDLDFVGLRAELKKVFKTDIPVAERDEWEKWLAEQRAEHQRLTAEIICLETDLNERVYKLFDLTPDEIKLIEESTKYKYGEV